MAHDLKCCVLKLKVNWGHTTIGYNGAAQLQRVPWYYYIVFILFYIDRSKNALLFFLSHNTCDAFLVLQDIIRTSSISETKELFRQVYTIGHSLLSL